MVIRGTPKNINNFIIVTDDTIVYELQLEGFELNYIDNKKAYFKKTKELLEFMERSDFNV